MTTTVTGVCKANRVSSVCEGRFQLIVTLGAMKTEIDAVILLSNITQDTVHYSTVFKSSPQSSDNPVFKQVN